MASANMQTVIIPSCYIAYTQQAMELGEWLSECLEGHGISSTLHSDCIARIADIVAYGVEQRNDIIEWAKDGRFSQIVAGSDIFVLAAVTGELKKTFREACEKYNRQLFLVFGESEEALVPSWLPDFSYVNLSQRRADKVFEAFVKNIHRIANTKSDVRDKMEHLLSSLLQALEKRNLTKTAEYSKEIVRLIKIDSLLFLKEPVIEKGYAEVNHAIRRALIAEMEKLPEEDYRESLDALFQIMYDRTFPESRLFAVRVLSDLTRNVGLIYPKLKVLKDDTDPRVKKEITQVYLPAFQKTAVPSVAPAPSVPAESGKKQNMTFTNLTAGRDINIRAWQFSFSLFGGK